MRSIPPQEALFRQHDDVQETRDRVRARVFTQQGASTRRERDAKRLLATGRGQNKPTLESAKRRSREAESRERVFAIVKERWAGWVTTVKVADDGDRALKDK